VTVPTPIRTLLVANRGEIVRRVVRTAHAMGIRTATVFAEPDRRSPHVEDADIAVPLGGTTSEDSYLSIDKIVGAARAIGADAVHPGYGFLSENAAFARACADAGVRFVGPSPAAIEAMGRKVEAKQIAAAAGVPVLPSATVTGDDPVAWQAAAERVGFPLLVKASAGGGGRGMRVVEHATDLGEAVAGGRREALSAFGDDTVFLEHYVAAPRHVEVQVFADGYGNVLHLFERECSVQRRHQKVIEEARSPSIDDSLRTRMTTAATALTAAIAYEGAGTVEFLVDGDEFWFLEMNTRLQVEHAVTEAITGLDLVRLQLVVASGGPLGITQGDVVARGHAIEARLYAEDVGAGYLPTAGLVQRFEIDRLPGIRVDTAVRSGSEVSPYFDPMIAKVVARAETRETAAAVLARTLRAARIHGVPTNRDLLVATLEHDDFRSGATTTAFLATHPDVVSAGPSPDLRREAVVAAALYARSRAAAALPLPAAATPGWRNVPSEPDEVDFGADGTVAMGAVRGGLDVKLDGESVAVGPVVVEDSLVDVEQMGRRRRWTVHGVAHDGGTRWWVNCADGQVDLHERPRFPDPALGVSAGHPLAPVPGTVVAVLVAPGAVVAAGDTLVVLEAMKMEHRIVADGDGVVGDVLVAAGDTVDAHAVLLTFES
jgi:acetyl/propionyl-CoA carboxylase alpha subunit